MLRVCVYLLLVLLDAGEQRLQPPCCAFTMSIQEGYDLETWGEHIRETEWCTDHMVSRSLGMEVTYVHELTHLARGERRSLKTSANKTRPLLHPHHSDRDFQPPDVLLQGPLQEILRFTNKHIYVIE